MALRKATVLRQRQVVKLPRTRHYIGLPPEVAEQDSPRPELLPLAVVLVIEEATTGRDVGFFLQRFNRAGEYAGDTWHMTLDEAFEQASYEYGEMLGEWVDVPPDVDDPFAFILKKG